MKLYGARLLFLAAGCSVFVAYCSAFRFETEVDEKTGHRRLKLPPRSEGEAEMNRRLAEYGYTRDGITGELQKLPGAEGLRRRLRILKRDDGDDKKKKKDKKDEDPGDKRVAGAKKNKKDEEEEDEPKPEPRAEAQVVEEEPEPEVEVQVVEEEPEPEVEVQVVEEEPEPEPEPAEEEEGHDDPGYYDMMEEEKDDPEPTKKPDTMPPVKTMPPTMAPTMAPTMEPTKRKPKLIIKKPIEPECVLLTVLAKVEDILVGEQSNAVGEVNYFPVFDPFTYHPIGLYVEKVIIIHDDDDFCTYTGSFNFDFEPLNDEYFSEVTIASSCMAHFATITGGNGQFSCASGWQNFIERFEANFVESNLFICYSPCTPHDPDLIGGILS